MTPGVVADVVIEDGRWADLPRWAAEAVPAALRGAGLAEAPWEVAVLGCDDGRIAALNAAFRGKAEPTNVLSWPSRERGAAVDGGAPAPPDPADPELGDVAIAWGTCDAQARARGVPLADHARHLLAHATLHLLGYDHARPADARLMEGLERRICADMGVPDPYPEDIS